MRTILSFLLATLALNISYSQINLFGSGTNKIRTTYDPIKKTNWRMANFRVWSSQRINFNNQSYCANFKIIINDTNDQFNAELRFVLRTNIEEWPINSKAYLIINDLYSEIHLQDVHSELYYLEESTSSIDTSGVFTTEISTKDFQLFRKQTDLSNILSPNKSIRNFSLLIYSGNMPIEFHFDDNDLLTLKTMLK